MIEQVLEYLEKAGVAISLFAVAVIIVGFIHAAWGYARRFRESAQADNFDVFKGEASGVVHMVDETTGGSYDDVRAIKTNLSLLIFQITSSEHSQTIKILWHVFRKTLQHRVTLCSELSRWLQDQVSQLSHFCGSSLRKANPFL